MKMELETIRQAIETVKTSTQRIKDDLKTKAVLVHCAKCKHYQKERIESASVDGWRDVIHDQQKTLCPVTNLWGCIGFEIKIVGNNGLALYSADRMSSLNTSDLLKALIVLDEGLMSWAGDSDNRGICHYIETINKEVYNIDFYNDVLFVSDWNACKISSVLENIKDTLIIWGDSKKTGKQKPEKPVHFNSSVTKDELKIIFEQLKQGGYFDDRADLVTWLYICGICGVGDLNGDFRPLNWVKDNGLLARMIDDLFLTDNKKWAIGVKCFTVKGKTPNPNTLKCLCSKGVKADNKKYNDLEKLLRV